MQGCRESGPSPSPLGETLERSAPGPAPPRRTASDETAGRRFAELLRRPPRSPEEPAPAGTPPAGTADPSWTTRLWSATSRESPPAPAPGPSAPGPSATPLVDLRAAAGPDGAALQFTVDDGFLAGAHMAFLLRGDVLELVIEAPGGEALARVRAREDELRSALAARGLELERFEAEGHGRGEAGNDAEESPDAATGRPARGRGSSKGERTG